MRLVLDFATQSDAVESLREEGYEDRPPPDHAPAHLSFLQKGSHVVVVGETGVVLPVYIDRRPAALTLSA